METVLEKEQNSGPFPRENAEPRLVSLFHRSIDAKPRIPSTIPWIRTVKERHFTDLNHTFLVLAVRFGFGEYLTGQFGSDRAIQ